MQCRGQLARSCNCCTRIYAHAHTNTYKYTHTHAHTHAHTQTDTNTYKHTHTHMHSHASCTVYVAQHMDAAVLRCAVPRRSASAWTTLTSQETWWQK